jgi:hypothetical protein
MATSTLANLTTADLMALSQRLRACREEPEASLLDLVMPTGKTLRDTTGQELRELAERYSELAFAEMCENFNALNERNQRRFLAWATMRLDSPEKDEADG